MSLLKGIPDLNRKQSQHSSRTNRFLHTRFGGVSLDSWAHLSSTHDFVAKYLQNLQNSKRINPSLWCKGFNQRAYRLWRLGIPPPPFPSMFWNVLEVLLNDHLGPHFSHRMLETLYVIVSCLASFHAAGIRQSLRSFQRYIQNANSLETRQTPGGIAYSALRCPLAGVHFFCIAFALQTCIDSLLLKLRSEHFCTTWPLYR